MAKRESFLLRIDPTILEAVRRWAEADMRSANAQIEFLLRQSLSRAGRLPLAKNNPTSPANASQSPMPSTDELPAEDSISDSDVNSGPDSDPDGT